MKPQLDIENVKRAITKIEKVDLQITTIEELETFKELLAQDKLTVLFRNIENICGKIEKKEKEVIEL